MNKQKAPGAIEWWKEWSPELAYILGFAFADGGIGKGRNGLVIGQSKRDILDQIASVAPNPRIVYSEGAKVWRLTFCEPGLNTILAGYGIVPNKTVLGFWPPSMPHDLVQHYLRGFFDGDGCISIRKKGYGGTVSFVCHSSSYLQAVKDHFNLLDVSDGSMLKDGRNYRLRYHSADSLKRIYALFYTDASLYHRGKFRRFEDLLHKYASSPSGGGRARGEQVPTAKLTDEQVLEIRLAHNLTGEREAFALTLGVSNQVIDAALDYKTWRHLP